jgi:hypothetical protein
MLLNGENRSAWEKIKPSPNLSITNLKWTVLESNPGIRAEKPSTKIIHIFTFYLTEKLPVSIRKPSLIMLFG